MQCNHRKPPLIQPPPINKLIKHNSDILILLQLRSRVQEMQLNGVNTVEIITQVEQLQIRFLLRGWDEVPDGLDDIVVGPAANDLHVAFDRSEDLLRRYIPQQNSALADWI